jgi:hypothetical protein
VGLECGVRAAGAQDLRSSAGKSRHAGRPRTSRFTIASARCRLATRAWRDRRGIGAVAGVSDLPLRHQRVTSRADLEAQGSSRTATRGEAPRRPRRRARQTALNAHARDVQPRAAARWPAAAVAIQVPDGSSVEDVWRARRNGIRRSARSAVPSRALSIPILPGCRPACLTATRSRFYLQSRVTLVNGAMGRGNGQYKRLLAQSVWRDQRDKCMYCPIASLPHCLINHL